MPSSVDGFENSCCVRRDYRNMDWHQQQRASSVALLIFAGAHLCGQAGSSHVFHLNFTAMEQDQISPLQKGSPGALFLEQLRLMGPGRYRRRHICRGPGDALTLRSSPLLARSLAVKWLTLKINSVISNKLFFLFLPLSISSGDGFLLVAISFHNTVE